MTSDKSVGVFSLGILRVPHLASFLGAKEVVYRPDLTRRSVDCVVGWGGKPNTKRARSWAAERGVPFVSLEDGFLRSVRPGRSGDPPLSMVTDATGIYYDATGPSDLEALIEAHADPDGFGRPAALDRASRAMSRIRENRLSKYNDSPPRPGWADGSRRVLVVDQTRGDLSIRRGEVAPGGFEAMLAAALDENPDACVAVKAHPDVLDGNASGHATAGMASDRVQLLTDRVDPASLLEAVDRVYVMTSLIGFEALMAGTPVTCFGMPFYAGWGLTDDRVSCPRRRARPRLEELFAAAYLDYSVYVDPETGERCEIDRVIDHLSLQKKMVETNAGRLHCIGMSRWKRGFVPSFVGSAASSIEFHTTAWDAERRGLDGDSKLVVWASHDRRDVEEVAFRHRLPVWRVEDGFLRSVGLGSDLALPASLIVDQTGIYYDPRRPSDLENILQTVDFDAEELDRAAALRQKVVSSGLSKYTLRNRGAVSRPPGDRRAVLVVGQVEDDASIRWGCPSIRTDEELLSEVRRAEPDAWIAYKPHPDVVSRNRRGGVRSPDVMACADLVVEDVSIAECLDVVDEVHTLTSLVGFEALLRGLDVTTYGQPFYAGWGLTRDLHPIPRRTRRLTIDQLVAGALLRYPRYISSRTREFTTAEVAVEQLLASASRRATPLRVSSAKRSLRKAVNLVRGILNAP